VGSSITAFFGAVFKDMIESVAMAKRPTNIIFLYMMEFVISSTKLKIIFQF
jgi:hypothetical protein